ncbi:hypothetical protein, partial [Enterococcus faecium]|uniref:hypothetical protein n=1 Tax=Enterococcus TaxID=1350 RepID=UPI0039080239
GNPSLNHRYRKGFYSLFKTLQQNPFTFIDVKNQIFYKRDQWKILGLPLTERVYTMFGFQ